MYSSLVFEFILNLVELNFVNLVEVILYNYLFVKFKCQYLSTSHFTVQA